MIYAIIGPTCVGKTSLSINLAKKINAEIINCDSMQVYKEMNIGTAKITEEEKDGIIHHLFNIRSVSEDYSVFDYQKDGRNLISEILKKGKNIIIVGGTGLYLKALLYDYTFDDKQNKNIPLYKFQIIGLIKDRQKLYNDIDKRVDIMIENGLIDEVKSLYDKRINTRAVNTAIGYKELYNYFNGKVSLDDAIENIKKNSKHYAKRQLTFFRHQFDTIKWYNVENISQKEIISDMIKYNM